MVICKDLEHIQYFNESALTIGSLDGMHKGHIGIISNLKSISNANNIPAVVITFDPHPKTILQKSEYPQKNLLSVDKKIEFLKQYGADYVLVIPFDKRFAKLTAEEFLVQYIIKYFNPSDIIIGYDHHFGNKREGNAEFLNIYKKEFGYNLHVNEPILHHGMPISSSRIRSYLMDGNIEEAIKCLGWE